MMWRHPALLLFLFLVLTPVVLRGGEAWSQLKLGMSPEETAAAIGRPMLRTIGRGFETWTYDNGAEALLYGSLIGWTAPLSAGATDRSVDIWRNNPSGVYFPTFLSLLPKPTARNVASKNRAGANAGAGNDVWIPYYAPRRR